MYKDMIKDKKAIIFDLDGTIVDTHSIWVKAVNNVMGKYIYDPGGYIVEGVALKTLVKNIIQMCTVSVDKTPDELVNLINEEVVKLLKASPELQPLPGFWDFIYKFKMEKNFKVGLVSNSASEPTKITLGLVEALGVFDVIITGTDVRSMKPSPEGYLKAAKELKVKPSEVLVFEDSPTGTQAAVNAGMAVIVIWNQKTDQLKYPNKVLFFTPDFEGLDTAFDKNLLETIHDSIEKAKEYEKK